MCPITPITRRAPYISGALLAMIISLQISRRNMSITAIAPKSPTSEESKKKSGQICSSGSSNSSIACGMYRDHFLPRQEIPLGYSIFEVVLGELLRYDFGSKEIIDGFKKIKFVDSRLQICIKKFKFHSSGETYSSPLEAYKCTFNKKDVRNAFEKVFKKCIDKGIKPEQIIDALCDLSYHFGFYENEYSHDNACEIEVKSKPIGTTETSQKRGDPCGIQQPYRKEGDNYSI